MFDRLKDIISNITSRFPRRKNNIQSRKSDADTAQDTGKIYALWLIVLPLLIGLVLGRLADAGLSYGLDFLAGTRGMNSSAVSGAQADTQTEHTRRGLETFLAVNPFHLSPLKPVSAEPVKQEEPQPKIEDDGLKDIILRATFPGIGAWIESKGSLKLVHVGKTLERYRLASVNPRSAVFRRGRTSITKYITYGPVEAVKPEPPKPAPSRTTPAQASTGNVTAADPSGKEGEISSELVNQLVQNPFDELKRLRVRPSEKAGGLEVQWIQNDSILRRLGVQRGDVIKAVNGIPFTNMGDIANSINSLMNSERFDVEVTRGGKPAALRYVVK